MLPGTLLAEFAIPHFADAEGRGSGAGAVTLRAFCLKCSHV
jgi:hypothetical protein